VQGFVNFHIGILLLIDVNLVRLISLLRVNWVFHFVILASVSEIFHVVILYLFLFLDQAFSSINLRFLKDKEILLHIVFKMEELKNLKKLGQLQKFFSFFQRR
jgi:hypothetical protein